MNTRLLREKMHEAGMTINDLASQVGIDRSTLYRKLQDDGESFKVHEMKKIITCLQMTTDEVNRFFFA